MLARQGSHRPWSPYTGGSFDRVDDKNTSEVGTGVGVQLMKVVVGSMYPL